jgi:hypothetical protein
MTTAQRRFVGLWLAFSLVASLVIIGVVPDTDAGAAPASAAAFAPGPLQIGPLIKNSSNNSVPGCIDAIVPSISAVTAVHVCAITARPPGGGGQSLVYVYTFNGVMATLDMFALGGYAECFGADAWPSRASHTIKVFVNCRDDTEGNGNDRRQVVADTGIPADPVTDR